MKVNVVKSELILQSVTKTYRVGNQPIVVLRDVDATFKQGTSYAITGPSGVGKSTLLHCLAGIDAPTSGHVYYNAMSLYAMNEQQRQHWFSKQVGLAFQQPYLIAELSVLENVLLKAMVDRVDMAMARDEARELLHTVGLEDKMHENPNALSGGQQQRVALARALMYKPTFLLADELTGSLDQATGLRILGLVMQYQKEHGMGLIISSHDPQVIECMDITYVVRDSSLLRARET